MIYFTSDLHLNHDRDFIWGKRGFGSVTEMNEAIISNLWKTITPNDELYILGDIVMGDINAAPSLISRIPGQVHFIWGNHDSDKRIQMYKDAGWIYEGGAKILKVGKWTFYLSHFPTATANYDDQKGLTHMIHSLCGHTHTKDKWEFTNSLNIGVDSFNCAPVSVETVKELFRSRYSREK